MAETIEQRAYKPRKPPVAYPYESYSGESEVAVLRTHDVEAARPLVGSWLDGPSVQDTVWAKIVPWCNCGDGHSSHIETRPITQPRPRGWVPALIFGEGE